jgi:antitoxin component YwqK of YwqJK toxin-antitoxin module
LAFALAPALAQAYVVVGQCRSGTPNGGYELRMPDGRLRVVGAFTQGHMTGTFIFWSAAGARVAVLPFDNDSRSGTVAFWYTASDGRIEAGRKLEAPYVNDRLHGIVRSWHPNGIPRADYRYEHGVLSEARAWSDSGTPLADTDAERLAARDAADDEKLYASLVAIVRENLPPCDPDRPNGDPPRS